MATALSAFYPWVAVNCPGVPTPVMDDAIRRGCREFCKQSRALVEDKPVVTIVSTADYAPTLTASTEVVAVMRFYRSATEDLSARLQSYIDGLAVSEGKAAEYCVLETNPLSLRLRPTPSSIETLTVKLAVMPTQTAATVDSRLFDWYVEGVTAYAKSWLMEMQDKPWSDAEGAKFARRQFDTQWSAANIRRIQGYADLEQHVEMRPLA